MNDRPANGYLLSKGYSYYVFALLFLLYMFDYIDRLVVVSLFPFLKQDWGLTDTQCGLLVSAVSWSILIFSFPASVIIDRWSRKKSIGVMALLWSLATAACAFTKSFPQLFLARTAIGIGEAGYAPGGTAMISALFPEKKRSLIVGIWNASIPLGSALGIALGGMIALRFGWRHAFGIVALPGLLIAILFFFVKDYRTVELVKSEETGGRKGPARRMSTSEIIRDFARTPSLYLTFLAFSGNTFLTTALMSWLPSYFNRVQGLPMDKASLKSSLIMVMAIVGSPLGGLLADRWLKRRIEARLLFSALSSTLTAFIFICGFYFLEGPAQFYLFLLGGTTAIAFASSAIAVTQDVVHPGLRATAYSLCVITMHLLGSALGPLAVGMISDRYGITLALTLLPLSALWAGLLFFIGSFYYAEDLAKVERVALAVAGD
jgi:predicted MFS family arabinose efflux permease